MLAFLLLIAIGVAAHKLFWYDELITVFTASLPTTGDLLRFYSDGLDTTSPVASLLARAGMHLPLPPELAVRFPFMLAFLCVPVGLYGFMRRRYSAGYALAALVFPLTFPGFAYFMTEARAYALMVGGAGLAMYFWQSAAEGKARPWSILGLWLALAIAVGAHFFAVFLFVPFAAAQLALDWPRKRPDWPVWLALLLFPAGFLPFLQGTQRASKYYRSAFHSKPESRIVSRPLSRNLRLGRLAHHQHSAGAGHRVDAPGEEVSGRLPAAGASIAGADPGGVDLCRRSHPVSRSMSCSSR